MTDKIVKIFGQDVTNVMGKSVVIHSGQDDFGLGGMATSMTTGNAGSRLGCGIIYQSSSFSFWGNEWLDLDLTLNIKVEFQFLRSNKFLSLMYTYMQVNLSIFGILFIKFC